MYSKSVEDYLEAIYNITERKGYARTKDISRELDVRPPSVTEMLKKLDNIGLVNYERYGGVTLTKEGERIAKVVKTRHDAIKEFLSILLISEKTAERDACKLEHDLSPETIEQLTKFVKFVKNAPIYPKWLEHFKEFCRTGEYVCEHVKKS
ncbi:MAG: metal-dependent transcriptional regulator [Candidatus Altiarchaeales archaeon]|nr:MAG: metal-dependent transcriptional regulator [Candidatus Altiarchaeales archaeon]HDO82429.1 metal-dependent transcriptional regulator [Candidatus Altiarchaeales archaeon]HEX55078.1 metal-dependent transcriptional regulator [Candidatus Altiarchaeales archaeon]